MPQGAFGVFFCDVVRTTTENYVVFCLVSEITVDSIYIYYSTRFQNYLNIEAIPDFGFVICCTKSGVTITNTQHLMVSFVRRLVALSSYRVIFASASLPLDYNWHGEVIVRGYVVGISAVELSFVGVFHHIVLISHTSTFGTSSTAVFFSR
jgi:hypothetical protein